MNHSARALAWSALAVCALAAPAAHATNGYFSHGYGMTAKGMGGASVALALDAFGGANNPASMVWAGSRLDAGLDWFSPRRSASRSGSIGGVADFSADSDSTNFFIPEFAYNRMLAPDMSIGITVYGNGGMNTDYPGGVANCGMAPSGTPANGLCGQGRLGVNLEQLIIAPTFAWKFHPDHSIGIAPLLGYQKFKAEGLQAFDNAPGFPPFTGAPGRVTNNGNDSSTGWGARIGYYGRFLPGFTVGAQYASKMSMGKFDKYKGLFAEDGGFDIPSHYAIGAAFQVAPAWLIALDYERINYSEIASINNPSSNQAPLGAANGPGFGWQDVDVIKLGVQWKLNPQLTLRAGYNHGDNPIRAQDVSFNILAPGVVRDHYTLGLTFDVAPNSAITVAYMHAAKESVTGASMFNSPALFGPGNGGTEKIEMYQNSLGVAWGMKF